MKRKKIFFVIDDKGTFQLVLGTLFPGKGVGEGDGAGRKIEEKILELRPLPYT